MIRIDELAKSYSDKFNKILEYYNPPITTTMIGFLKLIGSSEDEIIEPSVDKDFVLNHSGFKEVRISWNFGISLIVIRNGLDFTLRDGIILTSGLKKLSRGPSGVIHPKLEKITKPTKSFIDTCNILCTPKNIELLDNDGFEYIWLNMASGVELSVKNGSIIDLPTLIKKR